jgi:hypothetical protein|tara:strand:+ start:2350 stop:2478 length:129 start_codon:yes stop_codon:yes gene_type:complete
MNDQRRLDASTDHQQPINWREHASDLAGSLMIVSMLFYLMAL